MISRRYPNRRPSEFIENLDEYQAFELDAALAFKYYLYEKDELLDLHHALIESIQAVVQTQVKKRLPPLKKREPLLRSNEEITRAVKGSDKETPKVTDLLKALGGEGTVVVEG